jgi:AcrR family transcriptional regulator
MTSSESTRQRVVEAASRCLGKYGTERTSIAAVAREAGLSRQTVYVHFAERDQLIAEALKHSSTTATVRILARARRSRTAAEFVVEMCLAAYKEFLANPEISPLVAFLGTESGRRTALSPEVMEITSDFLQPLLDYDPGLAPRMGEIVETYSRFLLSLLLWESERSRSTRRLRAYLHRSLVPAMGLPAVDTS